MSNVYAAMAGLIRELDAGPKPAPNTAELIVHLSELVAERVKVRAGQYGPEHDADHGYAHLAELAGDRLADVDIQANVMPLDEARRAWVEVGQFVLAALELIDADQVES